MAEPTIGATEERTDLGALKAWLMLLGIQAIAATRISRQ